MAPDKIPRKKITKVNVPRVEKDKYEPASSVDPDVARLRLIHPDIYTPSPVRIITPAMRETLLGHCDKSCRVHTDS